MQLKTKLFDLTLNSQRDEYAKLVNRPDVVIERQDNYFGTVRTEEGGEVILQRTVDFWEGVGDAADPEAREPVYTPPIG